jgi:hypothetical protein
MRILFDQGTPVPLRKYLHPHDVDIANERDWGALQNGDLLNQPEQDGYELLITTDQNLRYQQNLSSRKIMILVLCTTSWPRIRQNVERVTEGIRCMPEIGYHEIQF